MPRYLLLFLTGILCFNAPYLLAEDYNSKITASCPFTGQMTLTGPNTICMGASTELTFTFDGGTAPYTFQYIVDDGNIPEIKQMTTQNNQIGIEITPSTTTSYELFGVVDGSNSCFGSILSGVLTVEVNSFFSIEGNLDLCPGESTVLSVPIDDAIYLWSPTGATTQSIAITLTPDVPLVYSVFISTPDGCMGNDTVSLNISPQMTLTCRPFQKVSAPGEDDGKIRIQVEGGIPLYTIEYISPLDSGTIEDVPSAPENQVISDLRAGTYEIVVTDAFGCVQTCEVTVGTCNISTAITVGNQPSCTGASDGSIALALSGAEAPITYNWNIAGIGNTEDPANLVAGNYTVNIIDSSLCEASASITLTDPPLLEVNCNDVTGVTIVDGSDGTAMVSFGGGSPPYTLIWSGAVNDSTDVGTLTEYTITDLEAGIYSLTIRDTNGCEKNCSFNISNINCTIDLVLSGEAPECAGTNTGSLSLNIEGNIGEITSIKWNDDSIEDGTQAPSNLPAGTYEVTVTDAAECEAETSITLEEPVSLSLNCYVVQPITSPNGTEGAIGFSFSGGTANYTLSWSNEDGLLGSEEYSMAVQDTIWGLSAGGYSITVTDTNGCSRSCPTIVLTDIMCQLNISNTIITPLLCNDQTSGSIDLEISGANGNTEVTWAGFPDSTGLSLSGLGPGNYSVTITDQLDCSVIESFEISAPPTALLLGCSPENMVTSSGGDEGAMEIGFSGGVPNYQLIWNHEDQPLGDTLNDLQSDTILIEDLVEGNYEVILIDANGCEMNCMLTIESDFIEPPSNNNCDTPLPILLTDEPCAGSVTLTDYYNFSNYGATLSSTQPLLTDCPVAETYMPMEWDIWFTLSPYTAELSFTMLAGPEAPLMTIFDGTSCSDFDYFFCSELAANVTVNLPEMTPDQPYLVMIAGIEPISQDSFQLEINTVFPPNDLELLAPADTTLCEGSSISISVIPEMATYSWSTGDSTRSITVTSAGNYAVTAFDSDNCDYSDEITVTATTPPIADAGPDMILTCNDSTELIGTNSTPGLSYQWTSANMNPIENSNSLTPTVYQPGIYNLTVIAPDGCVSTNQVEIFPDTTLVPAFAGIDITTCSDTVQLEANQPPGTTGDWMNGLPLEVDIDNLAAADAMVANLPVDTTQLIWTLSNTNCLAYSSDTIQIIVEGFSALDDTASVDANARYHPIDVITNDLIPDNADYWLDTIQGPRCGWLEIIDSTAFEYSPTLEFSGTDFFIYRICRTNCNTCQEATVLITVGTPEDKIINLVITPNDDSINDTFDLKLFEENPTNTIRVFNRNGTTVFQAEDYTGGWNGQFRGIPLPEATYYFEFEVINANTSDQYIGTLTIKYFTPK